MRTHTQYGTVCCLPGTQCCLPGTPFVPCVVYQGLLLYCVLFTRNQYHTLCFLHGPLLYCVLFTRDCVLLIRDSYHTVCCLPGTTIVLSFTRDHYHTVHVVYQGPLLCHVAYRSHYVMWHAGPTTVCQSSKCTGSCYHHVYCLYYCYIRSL